MTTMTAESQTSAETKPASGVIHPVWVRLCHWVNAVAMVIMIMSGWQIYNASPIFNFTFPRTYMLPSWLGSFEIPVTLGGWLAGALQWHFAAMWLLVINGLVYLVLGLATGRFRRKLLPITPSGVLADTKAALTGRLSHDDISKYNHVQKLLYAGVIFAGIIIVLSGLSIWKPVQFQYLTAIFGGYDFARVVHFMAMAAIVGFLIIHVLLALLVPKTIRAMIIGK